MKLTWASSYRGIAESASRPQTARATTADQHPSMMPHTARATTGDRHPGIYRFSSAPDFNQTERVNQSKCYHVKLPMVEPCSYCMGAGCVHCNFTGRACARALICPCPTRTLLAPTGGIPRGVIRANDDRDPVDGFNAKLTRSSSLTSFHKEIKETSPFNVSPRNFAQGLRSVSLITFSNDVPLVLPSCRGRDSSKHLSNSETNSGASLSGDAGLAGSLTSFAKYRPGRSSDSPQLISESESNSQASLSGHSFSGETTSASGKSRRGRSRNSPRHLSDSESNSGTSLSEASGSGGTTTASEQSKKYSRGRSLNSPKQLSDSESNSGASFSGASGSGGTTTASEKYSWGRSFDSPPISGSTPTFDSESSSDSGRSLDGPGGSTTSSPPMREVRMRSSSVDAPLRSPRHTTRSSPREAASPNRRFGASSASSHQKKFQERHVTGSPLHKEKWHQAATKAKERGRILGHEFKSLNEDMEELAAGLRRLRSYVPSS